MALHPSHSRQVLKNIRLNHFKCLLLIYSNTHGNVATSEYALDGKPSGSVLSFFSKSYRSGAEKLEMVPRRAKRVMLSVCEKHG